MPNQATAINALDFAAANPDHEKSQRFMQNFGLTGAALRAWQTVRENPNHPKAQAVTDKMLNKLTQAPDPSGGGILGAVGRGFERLESVSGAPSRAAIVEQTEAGRRVDPKQLSTGERFAAGIFAPLIGGLAAQKQFGKGSILKKTVSQLFLRPASTGSS